MPFSTVGGNLNVYADLSTYRERETKQEKCVLAFLRDCWGGACRHAGVLRHNRASPASASLGVGSPCASPIGD